MKERESGFYWCEYKGEWRVCEYFSLERNWYLTGDPEPIEDHFFTEIDERRIVREEPNESQKKS